ncbi:MAG: bifunctional folylpolyglutamate synthase/ dihydrofolate synthase [Desulfovibrio sp.]|jgi:dihydrofolate synthase/folylpolyglutamate synthase|nr:bifunctional folylpolyglutamate synthase/ dihydrofolate synthase [Desulfovibrio sp.]
MDDEAVANVFAKLKSRGMFHMDLTLDRMRSALHSFDLERPSCVTVQILGTNGKGSTAAFLERLCRRHGLRTGCYASPHFLSPAERIRIDGIPVSPRLMAAQAPILDCVAEDLTYFEWLTCCCLLIFREKRVDVAILEAGLGGRNDATTAVEADLTCFTPIAMDHLDVLGGTLADIASDKADAIRHRVPALSAQQSPVPLKILEDAAARNRTSLECIEPLPGTMPLGLQGGHQRQNASLALAAWRALARSMNLRPNRDLEADALAATILPGRLQSIPGDAETPRILLDGAHNPHGAKALVAHLAEACITPSHIVYACLADKDWRGCLAQLAEAMPGIPVLVPGLSCERGADPEEVAGFRRSLGYGHMQGMAETAPNVATALTRILSETGPSQGSGDRRPVLVTGSLYLLSEVYALHPDWLVYA